MLHRIITGLLIGCFMVVTALITEWTFTAARPSTPPVLSPSETALVGAGEMVAVYADGFQPLEMVLVSLEHESAGELAVGTITADRSGSVALVHRMDGREDAAGALPAGRLVFRLSGRENVQEYPFVLDYNHQPRPVSGQGVWPGDAAPGRTLLLWCGDSPATGEEQLSVQVNETPYSVFHALYPSGSNGLLADTITIPDDAPVGEWVAQLGGCSYRWTLAGD